MSGYFATHQASFAGASVLGSSDPSDGRVTVDLVVEGPIGESLTVRSYRLVGHVDGGWCSVSGGACLNSRRSSQSGGRQTPTPRRDGLRPS